MADREVVLGTGNAPKRGRVRDFVANRSGAQRLGVLGVVVVLLTAPFGGLSSAADEETKPLALGQKLDIGPFYVTVESVKQFRALPPILEEDPTSRIFSIRVTVTNHTDRAEVATKAADAFGGSHTGFIPWDDDQDVVPLVYDADDAGEVDTADYINPGLTYHYALLLRQQPDTDLDALRLKVYGYEFVAEDVQTLDPDRWDLDLDQPLVEGHLPVEVVP